MEVLETLRVELNIPATEYLTQLRKLEQDERLKGLQSLAGTRTGALLTVSLAACYYNRYALHGAT